MKKIVALVAVLCIAVSAFAAGFDVAGGVSYNLDVTSESVTVYGKTYTQTVSLKGVGFTGAASYLFDNNLGVGIVASYNPASSVKVTVNGQSVESDVDDTSMTHLVFGLKTVENYGKLALDATVGLAYGMENLLGEKGTVIGLGTDLAAAYPIYNALSLRAGVTAIRYFRETFNGDTNTVNLTHLAPHVGVSYKF
ncbi:MAG: porin family protein [Treponemataceae bacterium]|nr:porin family protein [Treponemataceae bacterium]